MSSKGYAIRIVSERTGLSSHVIRVWEKRYGAVVPLRGEGKHRLYSEANIRRLKLLAEVTALGYRIHSVAKLSDQELRALIGKSKGEVQIEAAVSSSQDLAQTYRQRCYEAILKLKDHQLDEVLKEASADLSEKEVLDQVVAPLLLQIGEDWALGKLGVVHEHMASSSLKAFLMGLVAHYRGFTDRPLIITCTPERQNHELGALMISLLAFQEGWEALYLGPNLPTQEIAKAVQQKKPAALALSLVYPDNDESLLAKLKTLFKELPDDLLVLIGGRAAKAYQTAFVRPSLKYVSDLDELRGILKKSKAPH